MSKVASHLLETLDPEWATERIKAEVEAFCSRNSNSLQEVLRLGAIEIAQRFDQGVMSRNDAMEKAAALYSAFFNEGHVPAALYDVYWALDEAEYGTEQDDEADENAPENRSRKAVQSVLSKFSGGDA